MSIASANGRRQLAGALLVVVATVAGCQFPSLRTQRPSEFERLSEDYRPEVLRARVQEFVIAFSGGIEDAAERIAEETDDPEVRHNALLFKANAIPACYLAGLRTEPLAAVLDLWAFCLQIRDFLTEGNGAELFGDQQDIAVRAVELELARIEGVAATIAKPGEDRTYLDEELLPWVEAHPIESLALNRASIVADYAEKAKDAQDVFESIAVFEQVAHDITGRLRFFAAQFPKQLAWEIEIAKSEILEDETVQTLKADVGRAVDAVERVTAVTEELPSLATAEREAAIEAIREERRIVLEDVSRQRIETLEAVSSEREIVLTALDRNVKTVIEELRKERIATIEEIKQERAETTRELAEIAVDLIDEAEPRIEGVVDHFFLRLIPLAAAAILLFPLLVWVTVRIARSGAARS